MNFVATMILSAVGGVVEKGDDFLILGLGQEPRVVLEAESDVGAQVKV